ncbi:MAG: NAD(P)H-binding protein [Leptospiraceae bacterium]|nr:NAD(P)H-binding protein [Leptospiraceae bacterium]
MSKSIVMMGATGAVGQETLKTLLQMPEVTKLTLLGRRKSEDISDNKVTQHIIDIHNPETYKEFISGHDTAICTLGVGEPSKMSKEEFLKIDKEAVLKFGQACKEHGVKHFELLGAIGTNSSSMSFYLRAKGELEDGLRELKFERLSLFRPSMILTPTNRYGISQFIVLHTWPILNPFLIGPLKPFRGIKVEELGRAMAKNILENEKGEEILTWEDYIKINRK